MSTEAANTALDLTVGFAARSSMPRCAGFESAPQQASGDLALCGMLCFVTRQMRTTPSHSSAGFFPAGRPTYFPKVGSGLWGVACTGVPHALERHQSWIAIYLSGYVHGWLRYCHYTTGPRYLGDPATTSTGTVLYGDKYLRFAQPLAFKPRFRRSHYLSIVDFGESTSSRAERRKPGRLDRNRSRTWLQQASVTGGTSRIAMGMCKNGNHHCHSSASAALSSGS